MFCPTVLLNVPPHHSHVHMPLQMELLVTNKGSENPFWLTLACQELRVFGGWLV